MQQAFNAGAAGSQNIWTLIILRFFAGAIGSSPLTVRVLKNVMWTLTVANMQTECWRYNCRYVSGKRTWPSHDLLRGSAFHGPSGKIISSSLEPCSLGDADTLP